MAINPELIELVSRAGFDVYMRSEKDTRPHVLAGSHQGRPPVQPEVSR